MRISFSFRCIVQGALLRLSSGAGTRACRRRREVSSALPSVVRQLRGGERILACEQIANVSARGVMCIKPRDTRLTRNGGWRPTMRRGQEKQQQVADRAGKAYIEGIDLPRVTGVASPPLNAPTCATAASHRAARGVHHLSRIDAPTLLLHYEPMHPCALMRLAPRLIGVHAAN